MAFSSLLPGANSAAVVSIVSGKLIVFTELHELETTAALKLNLDVLHCASALVMNADLFVSSDTRQIAVARAMDLDLVAI